MPRCAAEMGNVFPVKRLSQLRRHRQVLFQPKSRPKIRGLLTEFTRSLVVLFESFVRLL